MEGWAAKHFMDANVLFIQLTQVVRQSHRSTGIGRLSSVMRCDSWMARQTEEESQRVQHAKLAFFANTNHLIHFSLTFSCFPTMTHLQAFGGSVLQQVSAAGSRH